MSERVMSSVCPGSPYIRSMLTLSKLASAVETALRASAAPWMRPSAESMASSKLCTPSETRLTPASRKPRKRAASTVPGLASSVISAPGSSVRRAHSGKQLVDGLRREEARRATADEHAHEPPSPHRRKQRLEIGDELGHVFTLGQRLGALMRVEVAVRAFAHAPGDVHVQRERRQDRELYAPGALNADRRHARARAAVVPRGRGG